MPKFSIGEEVFMVGGRRPGAEAVVTAFNPNSIIARYRVLISDYESNSDDGTWFCKECNIRKKRPPEELSTWEKMQKITDWNPTKVPVTIKAKHDN